MEKAVLYSVLAISIGANIIQQYKASNYDFFEKAMIQKDSLTNNGYQELLISQINQVNNEQYNIAKHQGKIEGILSVVNNSKPEENEISSIWHSGYYRGLNQVEDVRQMAYEDGYHRATEDIACPAATSPQKDVNLQLPPVGAIRDPQKNVGKPTKDTDTKGNNDKK